MLSHHNPGALLGWHRAAPRLSWAGAGELSIFAQIFGFGRVNPVLRVAQTPDSEHEDNLQK